LGKTSSQQESDSSSQAQPKSDDVNNRCKQKKTTHVNGGPSESTTATGSKAKKPLGERETIPKIVSRKRDATAMPDSNVAEAFDGDQDQRKRQKTMIKPDLGPTATATSSNGANKVCRFPYICMLMINKFNMISSQPRFFFRNSEFAWILPNRKLKVISRLLIECSVIPVSARQC